MTRRTVITFRGTLAEFLDFLTDMHAARPLVKDEWDLTASIARHPAGKGLGFCCAVASDFASNGVQHSADCPTIAAVVDEVMGPFDQPEMRGRAD